MESFQKSEHEPYFSLHISRKQILSAAGSGESVLSRITLKLQVPSFDGLNSCCFDASLWFQFMLHYFFLCIGPVFSNFGSKKSYNIACMLVNHLSQHHIWFLFMILPPTCSTSPFLCLALLHTHTIFSLYWSAIFCIEEEYLADFYWEARLFILSYYIFINRNSRYLSKHLIDHNVNKVLVMLQVVRNAFMVTFSSIHIYDARMNSNLFLWPMERLVLELNRDFQSFRKISISWGCNEIKLKFLYSCVVMFEMIIVIWWFQWRIWSQNLSIYHLHCCFLLIFYHNFQFDSVWIWLTHVTFSCLVCISNWYRWCLYFDNQQ